jgi:hypothetical protein
MKNVQLITGVVFLLLGIVIFVLVSDMRAIYSGGFFIILGIYLIIKSRGDSNKEEADEKE